MQDVIMMQRCLMVLSSPSTIHTIPPAFLFSHNTHAAAVGFCCGLALQDMTSPKGSTLAALESSSA